MTILAVIFVVTVIAADVEPQVSRKGEEALHCLPAELSGVLGRMRGDVAEPVGLAAEADQVPERCGHGLEDGKNPGQLLGQLGARLDAWARR